MSTVPNSKLPDHVYINAFNMIPGIGAQKLFFLSNYFSSFEKAWHAPTEELALAGFSAKLLSATLLHRARIDPITLWEKMTQANIQLLVFSDPHFPKKLKEIPQPPFCLYVRGNIPALSTPSIAIVGSRKISEYGLRATTLLTGEIARSGITILSGLALGTDALAHRTTVENNGTTIAIVAGGVDDASLAPRSHLPLAHKILKNNGTIISEYPIGTRPSRGTFPARNRLMAGLSDATLVIEAAKDSGTLITAAYAHTYNKKTFVLPGSIFSSQTAGSNELIRGGTAMPLFASTDILMLFHKKHIPFPIIEKEHIFSHPDHKTVYNMIASHDGIPINQIIKKTNLDTTTVSTALTMLEIDGIVKNVGNQTYVVL